MTWAQQRQLIYIIILILFFAGLGFLVVYPHYNQAPTCFDHTQNGTETGMDCGGSCQMACLAEVDPISILWARSFQVVPGRYNAVAYLENKNVSTAIYKIKYKFNFADKDNISIGTREGETSVLPSAKFAVFEAGINTDTAVPVYTTFEFTEVPNWVKVPQEKIDQIKLFVSNINLQNETTKPALSATIKNNSLFSIPDVNIVTILYNQAGEAVSASRTYLELLKGEGSANINFTWPQPFPESVVTKEIIPMYNIFDVSLK